jgi:hypothetical protein
LETKGIINIVGKLRVEKMWLWQQHFTVELWIIPTRVKRREAVLFQGDTAGESKLIVSGNLHISTELELIKFFFFFCKSTILINIFLTEKNEFI